MAGIMAIKNVIDLALDGIDLGKKVERAARELPQTSAHALFTITGGRVLSTMLIGETTVAHAAAANATKLVYNPTGTGASTDLCTTLDVTGKPVGTYYTLPDARTDPLVSGLYNIPYGTMFIAGPGTIDLDCAASRTGKVKWMIAFVPLDKNATIKPTYPS